MNYFIPKAMIAVDRMSMNYILSEADASDRVFFSFSSFRSNSISPQMEYSRTRRREQTFLAKKNYCRVLWKYDVKSFNQTSLKVIFITRKQISSRSIVLDDKEMKFGVFHNHFIMHCLLYVSIVIHEKQESARQRFVHSIS